MGHAGTMSQRSIRSFFQAKPETQATKPEKPKDKSEDDVGSSSKENVTPNTSQCASGQEEIPESVHNNKQSSQTNESVPETNLDLPIPYRKTAVKTGKRVADVASNLQANSPKKIKLDQQKTKAKSPERKAVSVVKNETKEEKIKPLVEDDSQSPVKISK